jgi:hypothetical protein
MIIKLLATLVAVFIFGVTSAAGARLFDSSDFISASSEAATLNAQELTALATIRGRPDVFRVVQVTKAYPASLGGRTVAVTLPDGRAVEFAGSPVTSAIDPTAATPAGLVSWVGNAGSGGQVVVTSTEKGLLASISFQGKSYRLTSLPGKRYFVLVEFLPPEMRDRIAPPDPVLPKSPSSIPLK